MTVPSKSESKKNYRITYLKKFGNGKRGKKDKPVLEDAYEMDTTLEKALQKVYAKGTIIEVWEVTSRKEALVPVQWKHLIY